MLDVDGMKQVNDTLGHRAGDDLLKSGRGQGALMHAGEGRREPVGAGDEFVVLTDATLEQAQMIADRIRGVVCTQPVRTSGRSDRRPSVHRLRTSDR